MTTRQQELQRVHNQIRSVLKPQRVYLRPTLGQRIRAWWAEWRARRGWY